MRNIATIDSLPISVSNTKWPTASIVCVRDVLPPFLSDTCSRSLSLQNCFLQATFETNVNEFRGIRGLTTSSPFPPLPHLPHCPRLHSTDRVHVLCNRLSSSFSSFHSITSSSPSSPRFTITRSQIDELACFSFH